MTFKIGLVSLGCSKNLVDSEIMLGLIKDSGFLITNREQEADVLIINTCSFIDQAKEESINTILELARYKVDGNCRSIIVAGCLAQRYPQELLQEMPEIDGLVGTGSIAEIAGVINRTLAGERVALVGLPGYLHHAEQTRIQATPFYTAYLKIAEGCDNRCSYCVIPDIRGPYRSREMEDILEEAAGLAGRGVKELVLTAQDTTLYGKDIYSRLALPDLLAGMERIEGLLWLRILYAYPSYLTDKLIDTMAKSSKICRYLDLPLQHASDTILRRMNRRGSRDDYLKLVEKLRQSIPGITLRTSFIVGFPGETEAEFQELLDFMSQVKFDRAGVFVYSREEGTAAARVTGQVPEDIKNERRERAMGLQQEISLDNNRGKVGKTVTVLVEGTGDSDIYEGRTESDAPGIDGKVFFKANKNVNCGDFVRVLIKDASWYDLNGKLAE
ncbi:MAG: 30S ribosomal protein S12 methylthiotransferase RimO [Desulfotomaculaceae bacterium]|nr:30S ribosomal protein S12 methylthiotransferase RimO [Desulfotomaculaceae bacterium]MDD4765965.1 30S ribosomal protein S12 methylthiotransferase RimO [Desulfotomaculaceae bacterium]